MVGEWTIPLQMDNGGYPYSMKPPIPWSNCGTTVGICWVNLSSNNAPEYSAFLVPVDPVVAKASIKSQTTSTKLQLLLDGWETLSSSLAPHYSNREYIGNMGTPGFLAPSQPLDRLGNDNQLAQALLVFSNPGIDRSSERLCAYWHVAAWPLSGGSHYNMYTAVVCIIHTIHT